MEKPGQTKSVCTYILFSPFAQAIKIGRTDNVERRVGGLQTAHGRPLQLLSVIRGDCEAALHTRFADYRLSGEWFRICPPILDWLTGELGIAFSPNAPDEAISPLVLASNPDSRLRTRFRLCFNTEPSLPSGGVAFGDALYEWLLPFCRDCDNAEDDVENSEFDFWRSMAALEALEPALLAWHFRVEPDCAQIHLGLRDLSPTQRSQVWRLIAAAWDEFDVEGEIELRIAFDDLERGAFIEQSVARAGREYLCNGLAGLLKYAGRFDQY